MDQYAATTINRRLAAISGLFTFVSIRDPQAASPVPKGREARWRVGGQRSGMLGRLFLVAKEPSRGQPLTAAGLRTIFRYHRGLSGIAGGHPHALRHTFGTARFGWRGGVAFRQFGGGGRESNPPTALSVVHRF